uniref:TnrA n=1 Tax=Mycobacterium leprae TaxID=1769 RepID=Q49966_MYCLR|nr:tnrA [Mycobacterium leprae]
MTMLLSSHILTEPEALCRRVTIIRASKIVKSGSLTSLRHLSRTSIKAEIICDPGKYKLDPGCLGRERRRQHAERPGQQSNPLGTRSGYSVTPVYAA